MEVGVIDVMENEVQKEAKRIGLKDGKNEIRSMVDVKMEEHDGVSICKGMTDKRT